MNRPIRMLALSLTGRCDFACAYCYAARQAPQDMDARTARRAIDLAAQSGAPFILQFSGGEPLLAFETLREAALYARESGAPARMQVQTNASLLTEERAAFLLQNGVGIGVSLDGRPTVNDLLRRTADGSGATAAILAGAARLAAAGGAAGLTCVVTRENVEALDGVVELAYYLGNIRRVGFDLLRGQGRGAALAAPDADAVRRGVQAALCAAARLEKLTGRRLLFSQRERAAALRAGAGGCFGHCYAMNGEAAFVDAAGGIYACASLIGDEAFYLGDVWRGIDAARQEAVMARIAESMAFCRACPDFAACGGGCYARWLGSGAAGPYAPECALKRCFIAQKRA